MSSDSNHERNRYAVLTDADFSNDPLLTNKVPNIFEETITEESNQMNDATPILYARFGDAAHIDGARF
ncbi:unnamed protein product [Schistosoma margrebowiei]|uniref:Uncharacterized protein n=1 Tax=Schistosoma margrebowiei TaxID=48269 RepID=A0A183NC46_9TREM|nr:unnamed protein product [Schistosoma margrebowiei]